MQPDDLDQIGRRLRELRPSLPEDRLQRTAARARTAARQANTLTPQGKDSGMRSRLAITLMLVFGFALSGAGAGLAVTSGGDTAATAQYRPGTTNTNTLGGGPAGNPGGGNPSSNPGRGGVAGENDTEDGVAGEEAGSGPGGNAPSGNAPSNESGNAGDVQETRQAGAEQGGEQLPFTGLAAIPILLIGLALVGAGLTLRRGARAS